MGKHVLGHHWPQSSKSNVGAQLQGLRWVNKGTLTVDTLVLDQGWANNSKQTMACCQRLKPLPNVRPTMITIWDIMCYVCLEYMVQEYLYMYVMLFISCVNMNLKVKKLRPSDNCHNSFLIIPWVTNDSRVHLSALVSWISFRLLDRYDDCLYITYQCFDLYIFLETFHKQ